MNARTIPFVDFKNTVHRNYIDNEYAKDGMWFLLPFRKSEIDGKDLLLISCIINK